MRLNTQSGICLTEQTIHAEVHTPGRFKTRLNVFYKTGTPGVQQAIPQHLIFLFRDCEVPHT